MDRPDLRARAIRQRHRNRLSCAIIPALLYKKNQLRCRGADFFYSLAASCAAFNAPAAPP